MSDFELFQIEITKNYTISEWRDDLRRLMRRAGDEGTSMVFLFGDHQIKVQGTSDFATIFTLCSFSSLVHVLLIQMLSIFYQMLGP